MICWNSLKKWPRALWLKCNPHKTCPEEILLRVGLSRPKDFLSRLRRKQGGNVQLRHWLISHFNPDLKRILRTADRVCSVLIASVGPPMSKNPICFFFESGCLGAKKFEIINWIAYTFFNCFLPTPCSCCSPRSMNKFCGLFFFFTKMCHCGGSCVSARECWLKPPFGMELLYWKLTLCAAAYS